MNILIELPTWLGDTVMSTPAIENLTNFYKDSKKVSNEKVKKFFNYKLKFPSYVEGLNYIRDNFI